ncbi:MAG: PCMD domain-containing protein [Bacteroidales bacterium]|nr:PCMD domain-containing protein [Bacteroidales bacterium]
MKRTYIVRQIVVAAVLVLASANAAFSQKLKRVSYGDFEQWIVRDIDESIFLGGNVRRIYDIGKKDTIKGNEVLKSNTIWGTSNAYAKVAGIVKTNLSVTPCQGPTGLCAKLENRLVACKVIGIVDIEVLAGGSIFWGRNIEPISNVRKPYKNMNWGVSFTQRPSALVVDYKAVISTSGVITKCTTTSKSTYKGNDPAEMMLILQHRSEDASGNITAKRVGTAWVHIDKSSGGWVKNYRIPVVYGDATKDPGYKSYKGLIGKDHERCFYAKNKKGKLVPIDENAWADADEQPTHAILMITSTSQGAYCGNLDNVLWVDNVRLEYPE